MLALNPLLKNNLSVQLYFFSVMLFLSLAIVISVCFSKIAQSLILIEALFL